MAGGGRVGRRTVLRGIGALGLLAVASACASAFRDLRLTVATGGTQGVYFDLGTALADVWRNGLGLATLPEVRPTAGSVDNLQLLAAGTADVVFSQGDTAADKLAGTAPGDPRAPRALARIYDDVVHVVVPAASPVQTLAQLRGMRVSVGAPDSGVFVIAQRLLRVAGLSLDTDLKAEHLGINQSVEALRTGTIDAFFWSGGLPTEGVTDLAAAIPIRLLNLEDLLAPVRAMYPVYAPGTVPAASYGIAEPITTLLVRNFLLVGAGMADDVAYSLVDSMFENQQLLSQASPAALTIDLRAAIGTQPVPLHPGAEQYFQDAKNR
jgi:uncharacterized protein